MKKLFKNNIKTIFSFLLGIIITGGTVFAVSTIQDSSEISYDNSNSTLQATTVEAALTELSGKLGSGSGLQKIASGVGIYVSSSPTEYGSSFPKSTTIDLKNYTNNYANLELNKNLFVVIASTTVNASYDYKPYGMTYIWSYDNTTGILTFAPTYRSNQYDMISVDIYGL